MNKLKVLLTVFMGVLISFAAQRAYYAKSGMLDSIYSDIFFTRLAVETQQYTRQIEYGLKNGKSLENFYDIQSVLSNVKRCCSYANGAYIVSGDCVLLYSLSDGNSSSISTIRVPTSVDSVYSVYSDSTRYLLSVPILGRGDEICGYLVLDIGSGAVENAISEINRENFDQAVVIGILTFMAGTVAMIHLCRREERIIGQCSKVIAVSVCSSVLLDGVISVLKLQVTIESLIQQSVSKITMTLQNDLDTIVEKGVSVNRIYDLNSWLLESCQQVPFIDNLIYDKNYKIMAIVSDDYTSSQITRYAVLLAVIFGICAAVGAILCLLGIAADKLTRRNKGELKNAVNSTKCTVDA